MFGDGGTGNLIPQSMSEALSMVALYILDGSPSSIRNELITVWSSSAELSTWSSWQEHWIYNNKNGVT